MRSRGVHVDLRVTPVHAKAWAPLVILSQPADIRRPTVQGAWKTPQGRCARAGGGIRGIAGPQTEDAAIPSWSGCVMCAPHVWRWSG
jgi:hypothetical protein